ncbi:MAG: 50S ribosomal protein L19e [Candidatus Hodarchaeaceae archaeon]|nr:50S ribosomal protein L19e [Candidatus Hodarchaeaceae archaeon]
MKLNLKKRLAAEILKVGVNRVWIDPTRAADVSVAITRQDIRDLISQGVIRAKPERGSSRGRFRERAVKRKKGRRRGVGSRKGAKHARLPKKASWIRTVRPLRFRLRELKKEGVIGPREYRRLYNMVRGGAFRSRAHLETYLRERGLLR